MRLIDIDTLKPYRLNKHYKYRLVYDAEDIKNAPTVEPPQMGKTEELRQFADAVIHPLLSPDNWHVYSQLRDLIDGLGNRRE